MTLTVPTGEAIQDLLKNDAALCEELRGTSSRQEFSKKLAAAAAAKGIMVDEEALDESIALGVKQLHGSNVELSEEDLENVTGGIAVTTAIGIGVAVAAIVFGASFVGGWIAQEHFKNR